jgi:DNA-binding LacI/PurR family transcriptional regulator
MGSHKAVTLRDVAELAHVSQSVVSTVLSGRRNGIFVSDQTRENVLAAAERLGYESKYRTTPPVRKPNARSGERGANLIGLLLGRRFGGSLFTDIFYGVNAALSAREYHPIVLDTSAEGYQDAAEKEAECLEYVRDSGFAGIVLWHESGTANVPLIRELRREMPIVAIDRRVAGVDLDFVGTDHFQGAYEATRHLIERGHRRIAHLTRLESTEAGVERLRGYQQALTDAGLDVDPRHILLALESGRRLDSQVLHTVFTASDAPTAIFLLADFWAPVVVAELRSIGLRVPSDVALVGFDDVLQPGLDVELTSMAQNFEGIGKTAGELIVRRLADPGAPAETKVYPAELRIRKSSPPLRPHNGARRTAAAPALVLS